MLKFRNEKDSSAGGAKRDFDTTPNKDRKKKTLNQQSAVFFLLLKVNQTKI